MQTPEQRIAEIRERAKKATEGPWEHTGTLDPTIRAVWVPFEKTVADVIANLSSDCEDDGEFIAHAREDIPYLLAALASSESQRAQAEAERDEWKARYETQTEAHAFDKSFNRAGAEAVEATLRAKLSALSEALQKYGSHDPECQVVQGPLMSGPLVCDCGLAEALLNSSTGS